MAKRNYSTEVTEHPSAAVRMLLACAGSLFVIFLCRIPSRDRPRAKS